MFVLLLVIVRLKITSEPATFAQRLQMCSKRLWRLEHVVQSLQNVAGSLGWVPKRPISHFVLNTLVTFCSLFRIFSPPSAVKD